MKQFLEKYGNHVLFKIVYRITVLVLLFVMICLNHVLTDMQDAEEISLIGKKEEQLSNTQNTLQDQQCSQSCHQQPAHKRLIKYVPSVKTTKLLVEQDTLQRDQVAAKESQ